MQVLSVSVSDFRGYANATMRVGERITVIWGPNGAGKTNLLEALYFGCTGYSCRTTNERELVRFGTQAARVVVTARDEAGEHELAVGFSPGQPKRMSVDGASVPRLLDAPQRPLLSIFLPDRLDLIKGVPALRRAHLDRFVTALWPTRATVRRAYAQALVQRNSLLMRVREGRGDRGSLAAWNMQLARVGIALMADRREAVGLIDELFVEIARGLGLDGDVGISYRPRSRSFDEAGLVAELEDRLESDLQRGFTTHGPHRDDIAILHQGRELRTYGSQGQQRLGLLALLLAEREALARLRSAPPLMLLDDVMSELDGERRSALVDLLRDSGGQALITTTDVDHVPDVHRSDITRLAVRGGHLIADALAA